MKYQNNQNNMITLRAKEELHKTGSFGSQKQGRRFLLCTVTFAIIEKIRYDNEISLSYRKNTGIAKIQIFAMHSNFRYDSGFSLR